jgi:hypothetical protein
LSRWRLGPTCQFPLPSPAPFPSSARRRRRGSRCARPPSIAPSGHQGNQSSTGAQTDPNRHGPRRCSTATAVAYAGRTL